MIRRLLNLFDAIPWWDFALPADPYVATPLVLGCAFIGLGIAVIVIVLLAPVPLHLMKKDEYPVGFKFYHNGYLLRVKYIETDKYGIRTFHAVYDGDGTDKSYGAFTAETIRETLRTHRQDWVREYIPGIGWITKLP